MPLEGAAIDHAILLHAEIDRSIAKQISAGVTRCRQAAVDRVDVIDVTGVAGAGGVIDGERIVGNGCTDRVIDIGGIAGQLAAGDGAMRLHPQTGIAGACGTAAL